MNPQIDTPTAVVLVILGAFFAIAFLVALIIKINDFSREMDYLNREIRRTEGVEREHWKREKKRLWLSILPFFSKKH